MAIHELFSLCLSLDQSANSSIRTNPLSMNDTDSTLDNLDSDKLAEGALGLPALTLQTTVVAHGRALTGM